MTRSDLPHVLCPECGAENNTFANVCWICRRPLYDGEDIIEAEAAVPQSKPSQDRLGRIFGIWSFIILAFAVVLVGMGVYVEQPGALLLYMIVVAPLSIGVGVLIFKGNQSSHPVLRGITMSLSAVIVTAGTMVMLAIAGVIALIVFCLMMFAASGGF
ncbi:hypothetical protein ACYFX5_04930 [Bremerella sp. T1]|uniref:hypothetical protein n=1 Tax=Bremerella sp. TYQ1 TaxID=3119568 RepID=UPI001CCAC629|nr:hypothetical protein [Bremerella volcania]UBM37608.1 hypothetical protein LA756_06885 [Bremerella volcania]